MLRIFCSLIRRNLLRGITDGIALFILCFGGAELIRSQIELWQHTGAPYGIIVIAALVGTGFIISVVSDFISEVKKFIRKHKEWDS